MSGAFIIAALFFMFVVFVNHAVINPAATIVRGINLFTRLIFIGS